MRADGLRDGGARLVQRHTVGADNRLGEGQQFRAAGDTDVELGPDECFKVDRQVGVASTLTEEPGMTGGSVKALIERRHPSGDDLNL